MKLSLSLIVAVLSLALLAAGASPAFAAKGLKASGKTATTQKSGTSTGKLGKHHHFRHRHQKLTKQEKKAIKHSIKKQLKKQQKSSSTTASKL